MSTHPEWAPSGTFNYDENAIWMNTLRPAFGDRFFFEEEEERVFGEKYTDDEPESYE